MYLYIDIDICIDEYIPKRIIAKVNGLDKCVLFPHILFFCIYSRCSSLQSLFIFNRLVSVQHSVHTVIYLIYIQIFYEFVYMICMHTLTICPYSYHISHPIPEDSDLNHVNIHSFCFEFFFCSTLSVARNRFNQKIETKKKILLVLNTTFKTHDQIHSTPYTFVFFSFYKVQLHSLIHRFVDSIEFRFFSLNQKTTHNFYHRHSLAYCQAYN